MEKVISLTDRLREKDKKVKYESGKFPIFEGKVLSVSAEIIYQGETASLIDYLPSGQELPELNIAMAITGQGKEDYEKTFKERIRRAIVPFSVNPEIVNGANIRGYIRDIAEGHPAYVLEILKDENISEGARSLAALAGHILGSKYGGFQYIVPLRD